MRQHPANDEVRPRIVELHHFHPVLRLQRTLGNARVARMLGHQPAAGAVQAKHDPALAQRESEGGEAEEEELQAKHDPALQRKAQVGLEGGDVSDDIASRIQAKRGGGSALESTLQSKMEGAMGTSFKDVRIHRDAESDTLNRSITAKAFTTGSDIFLREDQNPNDSSLLAHELTHVVQQRSMSSGGRMSVGAHDNSYEQQADSVAKAVTSGSTPQRIADDASS